MVQDTTNLLAPATGAVIALAKTSDPIFQGTMGDGFGLTNYWKGCSTCFRKNQYGCRY